MPDLGNWRHQMTAFANTRVQELAAEIIEWQDTGQLGDGKLRELGELAQPVARQDALQVAESFAVRAALALAANCHPDNNAHNPAKENQDGEAARNAEMTAAVDRLIVAAKGMTKLYPHVWDRTDGSLVVFPENVAKFDAAFDALRVALGEAVEDDDCAAVSAQPGAQKESRIGTNTGHGHAWERPDGFKARCGGPGLCSECSADKAHADQKGGSDGRR